MIDAIDHMARAWAGAIKARLIQTKLEPVKHEWRRASGFGDGQGYAAASPMARYQELHDAAGSRTQKVAQFTEEGLRGDALLFHRCLHGAPIQLRQVAELHYVESDSVRKKAKYAGWTVEVYYRNLDGLHYWVAGRLAEIDGVDVPNERAYTG